MNTPRKLKRTQERNFSAHHMLIQVAKRANEVAAKRQRGWFFDNLVTMTFSALAIEALCNSIGERVVEGWSDFENASPNAKLRLLTNRLEIKYHKDNEPWATARWLVRFRNLVAHAKPELIVQEAVITQEQHDKHEFDVPESRLEKMVTTGNARRALRAAEQIQEQLVKKIPPEEALGLMVDGWSGHTTLHTES